MFSRFKKKQGPKATEKFEFRFQFKASGVPLSGYDRLLVCVVPSGRGKSTAKTQKAPLRNGSVAWPGLVGVRMKLNRDKKGGWYEEAVYRFVVTSTNSRSGILGEGSINIADCTEYVQKEKSLLLMNGSVATGTALHMTITSVRLGVRDGNDSASSMDEDAVSEDDQSQDYSESLTEPGDDGFGREIPLPRIRVPVQQSDDLRNSRFSQEPREAPPAQPPRVVLQPTRPTARDRMPRYDAYALNREARTSAPTLAPILIAQQPEGVHGGSVPSMGRALTLSKAMERSGVGSFLPLAQTGPPSRSYDDTDDSARSGEYDSDRPSRSGGDYPDPNRYNREDPVERRRSYGGAPDPLAGIPPRGSREAIPTVPALTSKPSKVKELAAQFRERELESPGSSPQSSGDKPQPRFQVSNDRYVGRGLDRREQPATGRPSIDSFDSSESGAANSSGGVENAPQRGGAPVDFRSFSRLRGLGGEAEMVAELERMEVEIEGLRAQSESWQRSARNYAVENEQLRGENGQLRSQMKVQIQYTDEAGAEAVEAARERDEARAELEKLRSVLSNTQEAEDRQATTQWEVDDARRHVEELEEELLQHKEHIEGLQVQLDKLTESNQMLVEEVKDFEEQHNAKEVEVQSLKQQLEAGRSDRPTSGSSELIAKVAALETENQSLLARLDQTATIPHAKFAALEKENQSLLARLEQASAARGPGLERLNSADTPRVISDARGAYSDGLKGVSDAPRSVPGTALAAGTGALLGAGTGAAVAARALGSSSDSDELRTRVAVLEAEASELASELAAAHKEVEQREARVAELERALSVAEGTETFRKDREMEVLQLQELVATLRADLATAREGGADSDDLRTRVAELEAESSELASELASAQKEVEQRDVRVADLERALSVSEEAGTPEGDREEEIRQLQESVATLKAGLASAREGSAELDDLRTRVAELEAEASELASELASAHKELERREARGAELEEALLHADGAETPRGDREKEILELHEMIATLEADLASAREGRDNVTRQYDRLKQLLDEDNSEERIEELEKENQELQAQLASVAAKPSSRPPTAPSDRPRSATSARPLTANLELLAQVKLLEVARETLTDQVATQAQEARSARLDLETRLGKAELERTEAEEKLRSLEAEVAVIKGSESEEKEQDAVAAFKGSLQAAADQSQQRLDASLDRVRELEEEVNHQSFLVSKAEGAAFEAEERLKIAHLEFSEKSKDMVEKLAAQQEELEQVTEGRKGLEAKHVLTLRGLEMRHGEKEQELQRKHLAEWGELHAEKQGLEAKHEEVTGSVAGLEQRVAELEQANAALEEELAEGKARLEDQVSGEKRVYEEKVAGLEAAMASITAQLNESLRVESEMAKEYEGKEKVLQEEVSKLEERVKELNELVSEAERAKDAVQKMWDDSEVSGKEGAEKIRALQSQLDGATAELKYKGEENEELNVRIEELHSLVEEAESRGEEFKQRAESLVAEAAEREASMKEAIRGVESERDAAREKADELGKQLEARKAELAEVNKRLEEVNERSVRAAEERDGHELEAGRAREEVETHRSKGVELAALLLETQSRLASHEETAGSLSRELESTTASHTEQAAEQAALLLDSQQKVMKLEAQLVKLTAQIEEHVAAKEANHRRMSFAMQEGAMAGAKVQGLEEELDGLTKELEGHVAEKEELRGQLAAAEEAKSEMEGLLKELRGTHEDLAEVKGRLEEEHKDLKGKHEELGLERNLVVKQHQETAEVCEGLRKRVSEQDGLVGRLEEEVSRLTADLKSQTGQCEELEGRVKELERLVKKANEEKASVEGELSQSLTKIEQLEGSIRTLTADLETVRKESEEHRSAAESRLSALTDDHKGAEGKVGELTAQLAVLTSQLHQHASSKQEVEARALDLHTERSGLQERLVEADSAHRGALERVSALTAELAALQASSQNAGAKFELKVADLEEEKGNVSLSLEKAEAHVAELESQVGGLRERLAKAEADHESVTAELSALRVSFAAKEKQSQEADVAMGEKLKGLVAERDGLARDMETLGAEIEHLRTEVARVQSDKQVAVERLEEEMRTLHEQFQAGASDKDKVVSEALMSATAVRAEKAELEERLRKYSDDEQELQGAVSELEKRVKGLDLELRSAAEREEGLQAEVKRLEGGLRDADVALTAAVEKSKAWQGEREKLERGVKELEQDAAKKAEEWQLERERLGEGLRLAELGSAETVQKLRAESEQMEKRLTEAIEKLRSEKEGQEKGWDAEKAKLERKLKEGAAEVASLTAAKEALEVRAGELAERATALQASVEGLTKERAALEKQIGAQEESIQGLKTELEKRASVFGDLNRSSVSLQSKIDDFGRAKEALSAELETARNALEAETKTRKEVETERDAAQSSLRETLAALSSSKAAGAKLEADKRDVETEKAALEARVADVEAEREALNGHVAEFERRVEGLTSQLAEARSGLQEVTQQREGLQKELQTAQHSRKELEGAHGAKTRVLEVAAATAAAAAVAELAALQNAHRSLRAELDSKHADVSEKEGELARHKAELEAARVSSESVGREFAEHRTETAAEMERVRSELAERSADVERLSGDVARVKGELAAARAELSAAVEGRSTAERQLAESTVQIKAALAAAATEKDLALKELESELLKLREGMQAAVAESTQDLRNQIEGLRKAVEDEKANGKRSAMQAANSASAETDELRDENFELKHRLIELETELKSGGGRRFSAGGASENGNALAEFRMKVTMLETELQNKNEQLAAAERRLQTAREEGIISSVDRPGLSRPASLARGIASPGAPELLVSPSGRSLLSPGTRRTLAQSKNGRSDPPEAPESPSSPAALEAKRADLQHRVKSLEGDLKKVIALLEKAKKEAGERERGLMLEVDRLQAANEQLAQGGFDLGMDQLRSELLRLQNQNAALTRSERELQTQLGVQDVLEEEVLRLQEANDDLFQKISLYRQYGERAKTVERLHTLEVELQEAQEANMMYKEQLKAALSTHQNVAHAAFSGDVDSILEELKQKKQQARRLESELLEMQNRYTSLSLKCAEVEANREEVVQELKRLKSAAHVQKPSR